MLLTIVNKKCQKVGIGVNFIISLAARLKNVL